MWKSLLQFQSNLSSRVLNSDQDALLLAMSFSELRPTVSHYQLYSIHFAWMFRWRHCCRRRLVQLEVGWILLGVACSVYDSICFVHVVLSSFLYEIFKNVFGFVSCTNQSMIFSGYCSGYHSRFPGRIKTLCRSHFTCTWPLFKIRSFY